MAAMNRGLNLPSIQRIMNEFERESSAMDMKEEMMGDAIDDVMEDEEEDEEEEGDKILKEVLDEIGVGLQHQVRLWSTIWSNPAERAPACRSPDVRFVPRCSE
jgi:charged multivesicular body protein 2A